MKSINEWRTDSEYVFIVSDLLAQPAGTELRTGRCGNKDCHSCQPSEFPPVLFFHEKLQESFSEGGTQKDPLQEAGVAKYPRRKA